MRPIRLQAHGFGAFREPVDVDFEGVNLFALIGNTGSGKSTIIDAMCFALYGTIPRYDNANLVAPVITTGASIARVSLTFSVASDSYVATRVVRRTPSGGATTKEARLEVLSKDGGESVVVAGTADEVKVEVERILGLTFDHFTRCVVLPQGAFARFLHDKPSERQDLLVRLLDVGLYDRMRSAALQRVATAEAEASVSEGQLKNIAHCTPEALSQAKERNKKLDALRTGFTTASTEVERLQVVAKAAKELSQQASNLVAALAAIAVPDSISRQDTIVAQLEAELLAAREAEAITNAEVEDAEKKVNSLPTTEALASYANSHRELTICTTDHAEAAEELDRANATVEAAAQDLAAAEVATNGARLHFESVQRSLAAENLAQHLKVGAPCPVCFRDVTEEPLHEEHPSLNDASALLKMAEAAQAKSASTHASAVKRQSAAEQRTNDLARRVSNLMDSVSDYPDADALANLMKSVESEREVLGAARSRQSKQRDILRRLETSVTSAREVLKEGQQEFHSQRNPVVNLNPPVPSGDLANDWRALADWAETQVPSQQGTQLEQEQVAQIAASQADALLASFTVAAKESGIPVDDIGDEVSDLRDAITEAATEARAQVGSIQAGVEERKRIQEVVEKAQETQKLGTELARLLSSAHFERWLVAEALQTLVVGASQTLKRLSGGSYSLTCNDKGEFLVVDHFNADEQRSVKTLSGGETFQASLALALALADHLVSLAAQGAARLESMFLDEGFGTLDPDTLNTVADTIESLGTDERMVGLVTHVKELAERIPVRYSVSKAGRTSTVERINS